MATKAAGLAIVLVLASMLGMSGSAAAQRVDPAAVTRCFVPNCVTCNRFNPYFCANCRAGYEITRAFLCNSCAPGFQQNLEVQTFTCQACPPGTTSPGGSGEASQCVPITAGGGRRLFADADEDLWA